MFCSLASLSMLFTVAMADGEQSGPEKPKLITVFSGEWVLEEEDGSSGTAKTWSDFDIQRVREDQELLHSDGSKIIVRQISTPNCTYSYWEEGTSKGCDTDIESFITALSLPEHVTFFAETEVDGVPAQIWQDLVDTEEATSYTVVTGPEFNYLHQIEVAGKWKETYTRITAEKPDPSVFEIPEAWGCPSDCKANPDYEDDEFGFDEGDEAEYEGDEAEYEGDEAEYENDLEDYADYGEGEHDDETQEDEEDGDDERKNEA